MSSGEGHKSKLSVHSSNLDKASEKISLNVLKLKNLRPQKPEGITVFVKIEFNETSIGESQKVLVMPESAAEINFFTALTVFINDQNSLDDLSYKPVIITLIEVLPKEKKQKEEKVQVLGQSAFDVLPLLRGETKLAFKIPLYPIPGSPLELQQQQQPELSPPEFEINVSLDQPLINEEELSKSNLVTVTLESVYSPPEAWNNPTQTYAYTMSLPLPIGEDKDNPIVFVNGQYKAAGEPVVKQKRWADTRGIQALNALLIPNSSVSEDPVNEEAGDFQAKEDKEHRINSEKEKPRVTWNSERRCYLNSVSSNSLREQVLKTRFWPIEIIRTSIPTGAKGKKIKLDEELGLSYHGVAYIDLAPLLYPGATRIRGAYKIHPYTEADFISKTKRKGGLTEETLKVFNSLFDRNLAATPSTKKDAKSGAEKKEQKKPNKESTDGEKHEANAESQQYHESKSFVLIEIKLDKPIIPRKSFDVVAKRVAELIPPRPKYPLRNNSAEKAVQDYHTQIKSIVNLVLDDYRKLFAGDTNSFQATSSMDKYETIDTKRRKLLFELNSTGKYFAFKEQLKNSVIKIVREKFLKTSAIEDKEVLQQFLSELYVFLVDEMHKSLNDVVSIEDMQPIPNELTDLQQMKHFAQEAEMNKNYDLANYYYLERIARERDNYDCWLDYATFNLLIEDYPRAEECLRQCIAINQNEIIGLLLFGVVCSMQEKYDVAEVFFDRVTVQENENVVAWCLYGLYYEQTNQDLNADITFNKTTKVNQALEAQSEQQSQQNENDEEAKKDEEIIEDGTNKVDAQPKSRGSKRGASQISKTKGETAGKAKSPGGSALGPGSAAGTKSPRPSSNLGNKADDANTQLNTVVTGGTDGAVRRTIFMKTAQFLIEYNAFNWAEKCLAKELLNPKGGESCEFHVLLAKIKLAKSQLEDAEKHACSALSFDYQSCDAWILWAHTRYLSGDYQEAKEKYERVLQFPQIPANQIHSIYIRLASVYLQEENFEDAKRLFLFACKNNASCMSWLGVGICCYRLSQLDDAEDALSEANILNNKAPEVWAYLALICLRTNRPLEAEQAYKYAIKLNLDNQVLLDEIHTLQEQEGFGNPEF